VDQLSLDHHFLKCCNFHVHVSFCLNIEVQPCCWDFDGHSKEPFVYILPFKLNTGAIQEKDLYDTLEFANKRASAFAH